MNTVPTFRKTPLATTFVIGGALLIGLAGCSKKSDEATENAPPASATAAEPAPASTAAGGMASDTSGMGTPASSASTGADMAGATPAGAGMAGMGMAADVTPGPITDTQFYTQAMGRDQEEIATAQMVAGMSTDADVKKLANMIINDHQAFDKKLQAAAGTGVTPPTGAVDSNLQGKTGKDLDVAYADTMVADHQKDIPVFENAAKNASTLDAKKLASGALPVLREHLKMSQQLQKKLGSTS